MNAREMFEVYCGMQCPYGGETGPTVCPHCRKDGVCELDEPWKDCDEFIDAYPGLVAELDEDESYRGEEEDESDDDW